MRGKRMRPVDGPVGSSRNLHPSWWDRIAGAGLMGSLLVMRGNAL